VAVEREREEGWREGVVVVCWLIMGGEGSTKNVEGEHDTTRREEGREEEEREEEVGEEGLSIPKEASVRGDKEEEEIPDAREVEGEGVIWGGEEPVGEARAIGEDEVEGKDVGGMSLRVGNSRTKAPTPPKATEKEEEDEEGREEGPSLSSPQQRLTRRSMMPAWSSSGQVASCSSCSASMACVVIIFAWELRL